MDKGLTFIKFLTSVIESINAQHNNEMAAFDIMQMSTNNLKMFF